MKKFAVLSVLLLLIPSVSAIIAHSHQPMMQTNVIKQGYEFAKVQGFNHRDTPIDILHWHLEVTSGQVHANCELQPTTIPPGAFTADIVVQCQTRSGMSSFFPNNLKLTLDSFTSDDVPVGSFTLEKVWVEARAAMPTPFPISTIGHAISDETAAGGSFLFFAGIGAIVALTAAIVLSALKREE